MEADPHDSPPGASELDRLPRMDALPVDRALAAACALLGGAGMRLSAPSIVARNEAARLPGCLASLVAFADEIVVVLDRSTDASAEIATGRRARVILAGEWALEGPRRNAGIAACTGDWVLEVDADETVPLELAGADPRNHRVPSSARAVSTASRSTTTSASRLVRHGWAGSFGTTAKPILFRRGAKHWRAQRVHPGLDWTGTRGPEKIDRAPPSGTRSTATFPTCSIGSTATAA